ncbi:protein-glutamate methylesterase/protein-glutamine glutaminase [Meridianimarinicoccus sp. RP-17]|uniref:protein-glutamate methylesterase/protein-glutamine glutaminase n=1 Tax=Meridianimarinicoccus zhengii TaxID=2056810 RepID=UPI000DAEDC15|nr:chemotaxis response regulator protein-glutamate methylesterase [Phycocomes zhengii]
MTAADRPAKVLIVDDSAMIRKVLTLGLGNVPGIEIIGTASSAAQAEEIIHARMPDVVTLDIEMPGLDGLTFLRTYLRHRPIGTVVISGQTGPGTIRAIEALEAGAVEVIAKPSLGVGSGLDSVMHEVVDAVHAAARIARTPGARDRMETAMRRASVRGTGCPQDAAAPSPTDWMIGIGASTGGVQALSHILECFRTDVPAIVIVQHMPESFTGAFARRLDRFCRIDVREAADGDRLEPGLALIAPGGQRHMVLDRKGADLIVRMTEGDPVCYSRPSVDMLFHSIAEIAGRRATGAILTGMGRDGADGLCAMRAAGARTLGQDEASSTVYGMPLAAWENGAVERQVPLDHMAAALLSTVGQSDRQARMSNFAAPRAVDVMEGRTS